MDCDWINLCLTLVFLSSNAVKAVTDLINVKIGDSTILRCPNASNSQSGSLTWTHYPWNYTAFGSKDVEVSTGYKGRFFEKVDPVTNTLTLIIESVTKYDAGKYTCKDESADNESFSTEVTVLDDEPSCAVKTETSLLGNGIPSRIVIQLVCTAKYTSSSYLNPSLLEWKMTGEERSLSSIYTSNNGEAVSTLTLNAKTFTNGSSYTCTVAGYGNTTYSCTTGEIIKHDPNSKSASGTTNKIEKNTSVSHHQHPTEQAQIADYVPYVHTTQSSSTVSFHWSSLSVLLPVFFSAHVHRR